MNTKKVIAVGITSSLVELKAEVARKQLELKASAPSSANVFGVQRTRTVKKLPKLVKNSGIEKRIERDQDILNSEEDKSYERAKYVLEEKAKLYDKLNRRETLGYDDKEHPVLANSLVDFQRKVLENINDPPENNQRYEAEDDDRYNYSGEDEDEWTEFKDSLGRTRRCLKNDLPEFMARDEEMARITETEPAVSQEQEALLQKHEEWQKQAEEVAMKSNVHYQDVLYDEIRSHGVGYFNFSKDDNTRQEQIRELKKMTDLTTASRARVKDERKGKEKQLSQRLQKIRQRKRAKLGLPAEVIDDVQAQEKANNNSDDDEDTNEKYNIELEVHHGQDGKIASKSIKQQQLRAWDFGKPGVYGPKPINFDELDEKWLKDKRSERHTQFRPPSLYSQNTNINPRRTPGGSSSSGSGVNKYQNFVKESTLEAKPSTSAYSQQPPPQKQQKLYEPLPTNKNSNQPIHRIIDELPAPSTEFCEDWKRSDTSKRAEIAPPATFEYYHGNVKTPSSKSYTKDDQDAISEAVTMGLRNLKKKWETKTD